MVFHDGFGNGQAQTITALCPVPGGIRPVKPLEQVRQVLRRNGCAGVADGKAQFVLLPGQGEADGSLRAGIFDAVVQQDPHQTAELAAAEALASGEDSGILRRLNLRFQLETRPDGTVRVAFADQSWESSSLRTLILNCLLVWALAMAAFFFVGLFLSSLAMRPVETAWKQTRQFVADASHELKTPLTAILANTGIVRPPQSDTVRAQSQWLEYTTAEPRDMKGLV